MFTAWVKWMVAVYLIGLWQKHCNIDSMGDTHVYESPNWLHGENGLCNHHCWNMTVRIRLNMITVRVTWMVAEILRGLFISQQIGYNVEMAFVTINVEIWWLQSAESGFLMLHGVNLNPNARLLGHLLCQWLIPFLTLPHQLTSLLSQINFNG